MCGIAGFAGEGNEEDLKGMIGALAHRGPDDTGISLRNGVGFAHARLAIIDLSPGGHQPMANEDESIRITFNGEIYNYRALKEVLRNAGITFKTESDTEVIIRAFEFYGAAAFVKLEGMFAFALADTRTGTLYLVRDRMGEKPLYWSVVSGSLLFASEPKAIFKHPRAKKLLNSQGVISYLTYDAVLTPLSMYEGVHKLEAASYLAYEGGIIRKEAYWKPPQQVSRTLSFPETLQQLDAAFEKSIASQLVSDVPAGVFLSGGLDSSIVAYYAQQGSTQKIKTFSLGFADSTYDESSYARLAAEVLGTDHHEQIIEASQLRDALMEIIPKLDEPIADSAIMPNYLLAKFAREEVTVALGGDGGDELFAGYQTFDAEVLLIYYRRVPKLLRARLIEPLVASLPVSHDYFSFDFKARQFLRGAHAPQRYLHQQWLESFDSSERSAVLSPEFRSQLPDNPYNRIDEYLKDMPEADSHLQAAYFYLRTYMQDDILAKVDRTSMLHSLEVRAPFLDVSLVELAMKMPYEFKYRRGGKYILKKLMEGRLPPSIISRKKHGFGVPVGQWLRSEWRQLLTDTLANDRIKAGGIFDAEAVQKLIVEHLDGSRNHRKKLLSLLMFQLWYENHFSNRP